MTTREKIQVIEALDCGLESRAMIILILLGLKPSTFLYLFVWNEPSDSVLNKLKHVGLGYSDTGSASKTNSNCTASVVVASSKMLALDAVEAFRKKDHFKLGECLGYPQSAIEAFMGKRKFFGTRDTPLDDHKRFFVNRGIPWEVMFFFMSEDNFEQEVKTLDAWWSVLQEYSPRICEEIRSSVSS